MKKKKVIAGTLVVAGVAVAANLYKDAYNYGRDIIYRERFYEGGLEDLFESIRIKNYKGLYLQGYLSECDGADKTLVIVHPFNESSKTMVSYVYYFKKLIPHCHILMIDMVGHGNSDGYIRGFGWDDTTDIISWNKYILERFGDDHKIIMYGKELGANALLNSAGLNKLKNVIAIISEGACNNVNDYLSYQFSQNIAGMHIVSKIIRRAILDETHKDIIMMDTISLVKENTIPTIYIHSKKDKQVLFKNVLKLYNANKGDKELFPIKFSHLYDIDMNDEYSQVLIEFLDQYVG